MAIIGGNWTYSGNPAASDKDAVRFLVGDTNTSDQLVSDEAPRAPFPVALNPIIGRERELLEAAELLEKTRLLTLSGAAGTGKSRLALALAEHVQDRFPDGRAFGYIAVSRDSRQGVALQAISQPPAGNGQVQIIVDGLASRAVTVSTAPFAGDPDGLNAELVRQLDNAGFNTAFIPGASRIRIG